MYALSAPKDVIYAFFSEMRTHAKKYGKISVAYAKQCFRKRPTFADTGFYWAPDDLVKANIIQDETTMDALIYLPEPWRYVRYDAFDSMSHVDEVVRKYSEHDINLAKEVFESLNKKGENTMMSIREKTEAEKAYEAKCLEAQKELEAAKAKEAEEKELAHKRAYANDLHDWYQSFADAGFSEDQAWMLVFEKVKGGY